MPIGYTRERGREGMFYVETSCVSVCVCVILVAQACYILEVGAFGVGDQKAW